MGTSGWISYGFQIFAFGAVLFALSESTICYFSLYSTRSIFTVLFHAGFGTPFRILWKFQLFDGIDNSSQLTFLVFMVNSPQLWFSICFLLLNNHTTRIWLETDWRSYYLRLKRPRMSCDSGNSIRWARKPRILQLPYPITINMIILGAACHWLISQAFFVVEVRVPYYVNDELQYRLVFYLTHSPGPIGIGALFYFIMLVAMIIHLFIPQKTWMPVMNGSVRVVLASCTTLTGFPAGGIAWGEICDDRNKRVAGFGALVKPLVAGAIYPSTFSDLQMGKAKNREDENATNISASNINGETGDVDTGCRQAGDIEGTS